MVITFFDASAILRFLLGEAGGVRVKELLANAQKGQATAIISAVNWGEVVGKIDKSQGRAPAEALTSTLEFYGLRIVPANAERAAKAALIKLDWKIGYADAFCVELAASFPNSALITADHDFQLVTSLVAVEFLPNKSKP